jgi:hypothetical protein
MRKILFSFLLVWKANTNQATDFLYKLETKMYLGTNLVILVYCACWECDCAAKQTVNVNLLNIILQGSGTLNYFKSVEECVANTFLLFILSEQLLRVCINVFIFITLCINKETSYMFFPTPEYVVPRKNKLCFRLP